MHIPFLRRITLLPASALLFLTCLGIGPAAYANPSLASTSSTGGQEISVFQDRNVSVTVSGGVVTAINSCITDASDGVIQTQQTACDQVASAGNLVDGGNVKVYQSKNVSIMVSGGVATATNKCANDASDGVIQTQQNACDQVAAAGNVVVVDSITIFASKNVSISITGGVAVAINECVNNASGGETQAQQNACVQVASAGNVVDIGDINILASKNVTIDITGGIAVALYNCRNSASGGGGLTQHDDCTQVATVGSSTSLGGIYVLDSKDITVKVDGTVVMNLRKGREI
jgi:hypothetical protein